MKNATVTVLAGVIVALTGVAMLSIPLALILAGVGLAALGLLGVDVGVDAEKGDE